MNRQKGFTLVEGLLIVLILSVVGFAGYYVWSQQNDIEETKQTQQSENESAQADETEELDEPESSRAATWKRVESGQGGFAINIPDGWKVFNIMDSDWVTARGASDTVFNEGTPAEVQEFDSFGAGGPSRLNINKFDKNDSFRFLDGDEENLGEFSAANATGTKYYKQYPEDDVEGMGPLPGQKSYVYEFKIRDTTTYVVYTQQKNEADILQLIEEMIATLVIN